MLTTPELVEHYRLHRLDTSKEGYLSQPQLFKSWKATPGDEKAPLRSDLSKPVAVESKRFPKQYLFILWSGGARQALDDADAKNVADFVVLLSADRTAWIGNVHSTHKIS